MSASFWVWFLGEMVDCFEEFDINKKSVHNTSISLLLNKLIMKLCILCV